MSWHFSQALVAEYSGRKSWDGERSALWNSMPSVRDDSCSAKMKATFHRSQYGMMYVPSTDGPGVVLLTSFREAFRAPTSALLEQKPGSTEPKADFGERCGESLARYDHDSHSWKTHQHSLFGGGFESLEILPKWGMTRHGELWEVTMLEPAIIEPASGWLPTPTASCRKADRPASNAAKCWGKDYQQRPSYWWAAMFKTRMPAAFPEWMMMWPIGWTASTPLEMDKIRQWSDSHGIS